MLNITGINRFYYLRNFHDMRCKYDRVLSIIHQQFNREPSDDKFDSSVMTAVRSVCMRNVLIRVISSCRSAVRAMKHYIAYSGEMWFCCYRIL